MTSPVLPIGFLPLVDAAPLIIAAEMDFARAEGLTLDLRRATSWSSLRDMVTFGQVVAAHMLSPMPIAAALGLGGAGAPLAAVSVLSTNGQIVGVSPKLAARMQNNGFAFGFDNATAAGIALMGAADGPLRIGVPFPFSMHAELLYYWLTSLGRPSPAVLDIRTVPPPLMTEALAACEIDAFCVGEPWGSMAVEDGAARLLLPGSAIWSDAPEKVLGVRADLADMAPEMLSSLIRALHLAANWLGDPSSLTIASEILCRPEYLDVPTEIIDRALSGQLTVSPRGETRRVARFLDFSMTTPDPVHASWIGGRLAKRLGLDRVQAEKAARDTFRTDLHRRALLAIPGFTEAAAHQSRFSNGQTFNPIASD